ncbi:MAG: helicase C-terminal domain-containing protein [Anaerolineae bacterium]|nr:exonuclease domain-containing protein [Anaerolineae bacterium]MDW8101399.1 helicase C-terminal domain-containing protein [Anaerolineae bacterium]
MGRVFVALDLETTGFDPERDAIIEIGAVKFRGDKVLGTFSSLVNPGRPVPFKVLHLTGITQAELDKASPLRSLLRPLEEFVGESIIVGHSIDVDLAFLRRWGLFIFHQALDTFELSSIFVPYAARYSLVKLAETLGIKVITHHRALDDAITSMRLFNALLDKALELPAETLEEIINLAKKARWPIEAFFQEALERKRRLPSAPSLAQQLKAKGLLGETPLTLLLREETPPLKPEAERKPVDPNLMGSLLEEGGLFARRFPGYEYRPQQVEMTKAVARALNESHHLLVEAGTGVGKSVAYLLPAIYFSVQNGERVVVSTNTINLQDQLYRKDLPDLKRILPFDFKVAILKGRSNYLCMRKLSIMRNRVEMRPDEARLLAKVLVWLQSTLSGDVAELFIPAVGEKAAWEEIASDPESCLGERCPYHRDKRCFFYAARDSAEKAHIVLINHALLLSDIALEHKVLPDYRFLIIDEAHHLEDAATKQLGFSIDQVGIEGLLTWLGRDEKSGDLLGQLLSKISPLVSRTFRPQLEEFIQAKRREIKLLQEHIFSLFSILKEFFTLRKDEAGDSEYDYKIRITRAIRTQPDWARVEIAWESVNRSLSRLIDGLSRFLRDLQSLSEMAEDYYLESLLQELGGTLSRLLEWQARAHTILVAPSEQGIYWAHLNPSGGYISLNAAPLHVAPVLEKSIFSSKESVILTSATLRVGESFEYIRERLGITEAEELALGSPFDYRSSALLYLPSDIPEPDTPNYQRMVEEAILKLAKALEGKTLVLFTSYRQLQRTAKAITPALAEEGILVLEQGETASRTQLLETFRTAEKAVLMGTRSFWEGIDVMGETLSCVIIPRLPFSVPTDPIFSARSETYEDPFHQYALPESILRLRQGFGRLIRSRTDRGIVVILDKRIQTRQYGKLFLQSLPPCTVMKGPLEFLPYEALKWMNKLTGPELTTGK